MYRAGLCLCAAACYAPSPAENVPCGAGAACPSGLTCDPATDRCVREPTPPGDADAGGDAPADATGDGPVDAPDDPPSPLFVDDFDRADGATIGNDWIEKNPPVYSLMNGQVVRIETPTQSYRDNMVYRPAAEDLLDVEISLIVRFNQSPPRYAQIFVRAQSSTITAADSYDGYLLYVLGNMPDKVVLGRQRGAVFVSTLSEFTVSPAFDTTSTYRLTLRAEGTSPVELSATVERRDLLGTWTVIGSTTASDTAAERIDQPGTVGFAGDEIAAYAYDQFRRTAL